jgi:hypothetical protein
MENVAASYYYEIGGLNKCSKLMAMRHACMKKKNG